MMENLNLLRQEEIFQLVMAETIQKVRWIRTLDLLKDINIVLVSQIGPGASQRLISNGIQPFMMPTYIDEALEKLSIQLEKDKKELDDG